ncbi:MAG: ABC transporter ATP-binding protein [Cyanobacteria bacterium]|nr:ABC transporter ATP-binding protein [Cyanobacteriota bacterium]MDW8201935.1 ABC transporter ATP-binding protein [Cyanobacteriota bacterium SKYGB_h_bin112]
MTDIAIRVENLSKQYRIGVQDKPPQSLRQAVSNFLGSPFKYLNTTLRPPTHDEIVWALKDVSFEVKQGEVIGVIGRNGAGKSTLLKILSRITEPTTGYAEIHGRVASLLEVGAGFHPELTGRENIYLNGTIMGMKKREIDRRFDEIVDFAGVEKYIDTPVKRYSSGMYVRLAFAVAAHLEPEILIVDEVLAVGDAIFQKKCLGKIEEVSTTEGRTVLFVSHNMSTILELCQRVILLKDGQLLESGQPNAVIETYLAEAAEKLSYTALPEPEINKGVVLRQVAVYNHQGEFAAEIDCRLPFFIEITFEACKFISQLSVSIRLVNQQGIHVLFSWAVYQTAYQAGCYRAIAQFPGELLTAGRYYIDLGAEHYRVESYHYAYRCMAFDILNTDPQFDGNLPGWGIIQPRLTWRITKE